jgi:DNA invertase Pin-like site-specific DNA recombinase
LPPSIDLKTYYYRTVLKHQTPSEAPLAPRKRKQNPIQAVSYCRNSTSRQELSLDAQKKVIQDWSVVAGVEIVGWFDDPARSGTTHPKRREGLLGALKALEDLKAGVLVVAADDRLSRDTNHAGWIATEVDDLGAVVVDASKPEAEWIAMMFSRMQAQAYLDSLRKNTVRALALKKSRHERIGSIPYGYQLCADGIHLEQHPTEHLVLVRILDLRRGGLGGRRIARILQAEGHQPRGASWNPGNLQVMADRWIAAGAECAS